MIEARRPSTRPSASISTQPFWTSAGFSERVCVLASASSGLSGLERDAAVWPRTAAGQAKSALSGAWYHVTTVASGAPAICSAGRSSLERPRSAVADAGGGRCWPPRPSPPALARRPGPLARPSPSWCPMRPAAPPMSGPAGHPGVAEKLGGTFVIDRKPGAFDQLGGTARGAARPDGLTLLLGTIATFTLTPLAFRNPGYDPLADFVHITQVAKRCRCWSPIHAGKAWMRCCRGAGEARGPVLCHLGRRHHGAPAHAGPAHPDRHRDAACALQRTAPPALTDTIAGRTDCMFALLAACKGHLEGGRLRGLAMADAAMRPASLPDVPTFAELGIPDFRLCRLVRRCRRRRHARA